VDFGRNNLLPELTRIPLNDEDRAGHLRKLFHDLTCRLRLAKDAHLKCLVQMGGLKS